MRRITDRYTWKRVFLFAALFIWLFNAYAAQPYVDGRSYIAVWVVACIGCWTASGWLLDLPRLIFPEVEAFRHLRRPAPRQKPSASSIGIDQMIDTPTSAANTINPGSPKYCA